MNAVMFDYETWVTIRFPEDEAIFLATLCDQHKDKEVQAMGCRLQDPALRVLNHKTPPDIFVTCRLNTEDIDTLLKPMEPFIQSDSKIFAHYKGLCDIRRDLMQYCELLPKGRQSNGNQGL